MDFRIVSWYTGVVVATYKYKGGRHRARINRQVAKMNEHWGQTRYVIENI